jgi:hypothetical protein
MTRSRRTTELAVILLGVLGWPAAFLGALGRILYDARREAAVS